ncbi:unnamed protein product (macronuclear) [Paramecium tetraurelia]|uniref:Response regulatory domain-containing protein n=1 Tax=Paramecium tetraurelia TaxID=5888 RepID=A0BJT4_PARTE|nr:uncharacterized protein GSPATT00029430001 [Paramecium tetraurelia]CAK58801.1 unnamed protein product [Paramecium tetraurelia]|eukprot:XP_001426199.1 hypothetical protein (macronuclear) [Paramecium tetraurelia strain d4-2]
MRSINNSIDTPSIKVKFNHNEKVDEMRTTKTMKKMHIQDEISIVWEYYMYMIMAILVEIIVLIFNNETKILNMIRITILILIFIISLVYARKMQQNLLLCLICLIKILQTSTIGLNDQIYLIVMIPFAYDSITYNSKVAIKLKLFEQILIKIIGVSLICIFYKLPLAITINLCLMTLEIYRNRIIFMKKEGTKSLINYKIPIEYEQVVQSARGDNTQREDIWKKRFYIIPLSILLISKETLKITYKNQTLFKQFCDSFINEEELEDLILNKLHFSLLSDHQEFVQLSSTNIIKLKQKKSNSYNLFPQKSCMAQLNTYDLMQKRTLIEILTSIKSEMYNIQKDVIELFCQQTELSGAKYQLEAKIILSDKDDEFFVTINDTTKQNEIQQFIVKEEFKSKIIESFSHELRTPLNSAINFLEASISDSTIDDKLKLQTLEPAVNSLKLQSYLINDIIDYQHYNANQLELYVTEFSLQDFLSELTSLFSIQFDMKKIAFNLDLQKNSLQYLSTDQTRLTQILVNLLQNSLKYTSSGVIQLKFSSVSNDILKIVIQDSGVGIAPNVLEQVRITLKYVEESKDFQTFKAWKGFGLLIVALLHQSLSNQLDSIRETKIKFYILNFNYSSKQNTIKQSLSAKNTLRQSQSVKKSFQSNSLSQILPMNGTIFLAQDIAQVNQHMKRSEKYLNSGSNTLDDFSELSKSPIIQFCSPDANISQLVQIHPVLITDIKSSQKISIKNINPQYQSQKSQKSQMFSLNQFRKMETQHREDIFKTLATKLNKCNCKIILSVDDEIFNQKSVERLLQQVGFDVKLAFSGDEAINLVLNLKPCSLACNLLTIILMDYLMPRKDGIATTKELKKLMLDGLIPEIPIIGLTAFTGQQDIKNCLIAGMSDVLSKPLKIQELKDVLASL